MPRYEDNTMPSYAQKILLVLLAFILPPLPIVVLSNNSIFTQECLISVILTLLGHIPGVLFSLYYILIEYPKRLARLYGREGYIRIEDEDEIRPSQFVHDGQLSQDPEESQAIDGPLLVILPNYRDGDNNYESNQLEPSPPNYEDIVGASDNQRDSKLAGDNKVQY